MLPAATQYLTPQAVAAQLGLSKPDPVLTWIRRGELKAVNVGTRAGGRPTWRIAAPDLETFIRSRQAQPPAPAVRRRKAKAPAVTEYF